MANTAEHTPYVSRMKGKMLPIHHLPRRALGTITLASLADDYHSTLLYMCFNEIYAEAKPTTTKRELSQLAKTEYKAIMAHDKKTVGLLVKTLMHFGLDCRLFTTKAVPSFGLIVRGYFAVIDEYRERTNKYGKLHPMDADSLLNGMITDWIAGEVGERNHA